MAWTGSALYLLIVYGQSIPSLHMNMKRKELTRSEIHPRKDVKYNRLSDALWHNE